MKEVRESNRLNYGLNNRPKIKCEVETLPCMSFYLYHITDFPLE